MLPVKTSRPFRNIDLAEQYLLRQPLSREPFTMRVGESFVPHPRIFPAPPPVRDYVPETQTGLQVIAPDTSLATRTLRS